MQQSSIFPSAPSLSKPVTDFRTKMFGPLDSRHTPLKNKSMCTFLNDTPSLQLDRTNNSFVRRSHNKKSRGRTLTPSQDPRRSLQANSFRVLDNFLSQINFSPAAILNQEKEIPSPGNTKESPIFIRRVNNSSSSKSKKIGGGSLDNLPDTPNGKGKFLGKLEFSNKKEVPASLDAIPEDKDFEIEEIAVRVKRERGTSVDSGMKVLPTVYRRRVEPGMFRMKKKMNNNVVNVIEEVEEVSTYRGKRDDGDQNNSRTRQDFDDDSEEWRCTSSSSFIISKLSRNTSRIEDYKKENLDKEILDFVKRRLSKKERLLGRQDREIVRESFSQELLKMKDAIENALIRCHESSKDLIINASP